MKRYRLVTNNTLIKVDEHYTHDDLWGGEHKNVRVNYNELIRR
jgi:hypothetical protein